MHEIVVEPDPTMLVELRLPQLKPLGTLSDNVTVPLNPLKAVIVMVAVLDCPALTAAGWGVLREKSGCLTVNVAIAE